MGSACDFRSNVKRIEFKVRTTENCSSNAIGVSLYAPVSGSDLILRRP